VACLVSRCFGKMASRGNARRSPRLRSPQKTCMGTPPQTPSPRSPLRTPIMSRTPPLLCAANYSPLKTPPLFSNISPLNINLTPPLLYDDSWRTEPTFHYDLRWLSSPSPAPTSSPARLNIMVPAGINPAIVPTTMREIDQFLESAWNDVYGATPSEHSRKVTRRVYLKCMLYWSSCTYSDVRTWVLLEYYKYVEWLLVKCIA